MNKMFSNKKGKLLVAVAACVAVLCISPAYAGVGMLEEGESLYNSDLSLSGGNEHWNVQRNVITSLCKRRNVNLVQGYEYGYSYFHTIFANVNFAHRRCGQDNLRGGGVALAGKTTGIGDIKLGVRTRFNHRDTAAWEVLLVIPTGYDNSSPASLGRGAMGLGLGLKFSSDARDFNARSWGWKLGSRFTYFFSGKGNSLTSFAAVQYGFTNTDFEQSGNFLDFRLIHNIGFVRNGVQQQIFVNQNPSSITSSDQTKIQASYSHAIGDGWSTSIRAGKAIFGRNSPIDYFVGWGLSYRWRD